MKARKVLLPVSPKDFYLDAKLASMRIIDRRDRKQFMDWVKLFKEDAKEVKNNLTHGLYEYYAVSMIVFDGMDGKTEILENGKIRLTKGYLHVDMKEEHDTEFPLETWVVVRTVSYPMLFELLVNEYNNVDNRYRCRIHGITVAKRHNEPFVPLYSNDAWFM